MENVQNSLVRQVHCLLAPFLFYTVVYFIPVLQVSVLSLSLLCTFAVIYSSVKGNKLLTISVTIKRNERLGKIVAS